ncbi:hypothetical protein ETD83_29470 [Actinomadura soli]|uniref:Uncharacterized protein n=1 Tax=Actinomadura soli TaxID=2508997 RepID=A0A5C4J4J0_9ACTN|nr:hypothetical protein [Actinomadura soli]TMQ91734.1 hypothetical protein ETD83_29470 [Actinomadura soli]
MQLVEDRQDPLHGIAEVAVAEVLLGGDEGDAHLGELRLGGELFQGVPEGPAHHVDDDVLDVRQVRQVGHHLLEGHALVEAGGRAARLNVLPHYRHAHVVGLALADAALGGDGVAFGVVVGVGVHLLLGGDA